MLERLMAKLGYIPKPKYEQLKTVLKDTMNGYEESSKTVSKRTKKIYSLDKQLRNSNNLIENQVLEINSLKTTISNLQQKNHKLEKSLKETKRKEALLLKKQGNFKEKLSKNEIEINSLNKEIIYLNQKIKLLESYSYAVVAKLEELCFGSVLPRVMKQMDLSKYRLPLQPIKVVYEQVGDDVKVEAVGVTHVDKTIT